MEYDDTTKEIRMHDAIYTGLHAQKVYKVPLQITMDECWIRNNNLLNLRNRKKLCLVLDLDHTLLHTKRVHKLSPKEQDSLYDFFKKDDICRWKSMGVKYLTKLRPFVREFLGEASKLFDLYIYTNGSRDYARRMVGFLDPDHVYFGSRIISMEDSTVKGQKGLDVVPVHTSGVLILDDTEKVWARDRGNLVVIKEYNYFELKDPNPNSSRSLFEEGMDESVSAGALSCALRLLQQVHRSYFKCCHRFDVNILLKSLATGNRNHEEKLQELEIETSCCEMGSQKRLRVSDECSSCDVTKRQRC